MFVKAELMLCCCLFTCLTAVQGCITLTQRRAVCWSGRKHDPSHGICSGQQCLRTKGGLDGSHRRCLSYQIGLKLKNRNDSKIDDRKDDTCRNRERKQAQTNNLLLKRCISCSQKVARLGWVAGLVGRAWWPLMHRGVHLAESPLMETIVGSTPAQALLCRAGTLSLFLQFSPTDQESFQPAGPFSCCLFSAPELIYIKIRSVNIPLRKVILNEWALCVSTFVLAHVVVFATCLETECGAKQIVS